MNCVVGYLCPFREISFKGKAIIISQVITIVALVIFNIFFVVPKVITISLLAISSVVILYGKSLITEKQPVSVHLSSKDAGIVDRKELYEKLVQDEIDTSKAKTESVAENNCLISAANREDKINNAIFNLSEIEKSHQVLLKEQIKFIEGRIIFYKKIINQLEQKFVCESSSILKQKIQNNLESHKRKLQQEEDNLFKIKESFVG